MTWKQTMTKLIAVAMNQTLDQNPELKKKVMAVLFGEPKQNNN